MLGSRPQLFLAGCRRTPRICRDSGRHEAGRLSGEPAPNIGVEPTAEKRGGSPRRRYAYGSNMIGSEASLSESTLRLRYDLVWAHALLWLAQTSRGGWPKPEV